jgi:hypothetical protein
LGSKIHLPGLPQLAFGESELGICHIVVKFGPKGVEHLRLQIKYDQGIPRKYLEVDHQNLAFRYVLALYVVCFLIVLANVLIELLRGINVVVVLHQHFVADVVLAVVLSDNPKEQLLFAINLLSGEKQPLCTLPQSN